MEDKEKARHITSRRISKFKRKYGDAELNLQDIIQKPTLTRRDKDVLISLFYQRCLTTRQIAEIHYKYNYSKGTENNQADVIARRRIRNLFNLQLVDRFFVDVGNEGSSQGHIVLDNLGARVVAGLLGQKFEDIHWRYEMNETRLPYLSHMIDTNNFYIYLLRAARKLGHEVTGFRTENHCHHSFKFWGTSMVCNPDAYGQYWIPSEDKENKEDEGFHFFLEWDNGTMTPAVFQRKHKRYSAFYASGTYEPIYGEFPLILTVAPTKARALQLRNAIYGIDNTDLQWLFAAKDEVEVNPLGTIWYAKDEKPVALI